MMILFRRKSHYWVALLHRGSLQVRMLTLTSPKQLFHISNELHLQIKIHAVSHQETMPDLVEWVMADYFNTLQDSGDLRQLNDERIR